MESEDNKLYFNYVPVDYSYIYRDKGLVIGIVKNDNILEQEGVEERVNEYCRLYSRMTPGFVMGEMKIKHDTAHNFGVFTFKSNAPDRDLFNIFSITNYDNKELCLFFSGTYIDAPQYIPLFVELIDKMIILEK